MRGLGLAALLLLLTGCLASPEASRVPGQPGADIGNHGDPVQMLGSQDRAERIFYGFPFDEPPETSSDLSQS